MESNAIAKQHQALSPASCARALESITEDVCGPRLSRALHAIIFNRQDPQECRRFIACYPALMAAYGQAGYPISRAPLDFQEEAMARLETFPEVCAAIKQVFDPNGVLSPGRFGIG
jgi:4-cresol dehydrogenase (hydroxylating)